MPVRNYRQRAVNRRPLPRPSEPRGDVPTSKSGGRRHLGAPHRLRPDVHLLRHARRAWILRPVHAIRHSVSQEGKLHLYMWHHQIDMI